MADVAKQPSSSDSRRRDAPSSSSSSSSRPSSNGGKPSSSSSSSSSSERAREEEKRRRAPPGKDATPEERAQYEIERKKIQKYKEDKLKARRDHTRMILESHAQAKRRALLGKQSEFLANLEFRNVLPDLPFDTKFLQYPHEADRLVKYKPNSLEMDYTYEVHEESNLGLDIDLIDPAKYEAPENPGPLEIGDEQVLMMKEVSRNAKAKLRPSVTWLRRTEYMGTDLSEMTHKFRSEIEIQEALREGTENALAEVVAHTLEDRAELSFRDVCNPKTLVHPSNKSLKAAKIWDVYPDQLLGPNKYAVLSYDLLPSHDLKGKNIADRENRALLCGVLPRKDAVQGSILLPNARDEEEDSEELHTEKFGYYRDYQMSIDVLENRPREDAQHVIFVLDPESNSFTYADIQHRIQLRKTKIASEDKRRRGAIVRRRPYSQAELERRHALQFEFGGIYDKSLDHEELTRQHKRQRSKDRGGGDDDGGKSEDDEPPALTSGNGDAAAGASSPAISSGSDSD